MKKITMITVLTAIFLSVGITNDSSAEILNIDKPVMSDDKKWDDQKSKDFMKDMIWQGMLMVHSSQLVIDEQGIHDDVKELAMIVLDNHKKANLLLREIAEDMNMKLPEEMAAKQDNKIGELRRMGPYDLSDSYIDMLVKHQNELIKKLDKAEDMTNNRELEEWIETFLPYFLLHHYKALQLQDDKAWKAEE